MKSFAFWSNIRLQYFFHVDCNGRDISKIGKRWVIYSGEFDASKIPSEWYSWIHFTKNRIENNHDLEKYKWQKPHQSNQTGTDNAYHPNRNNEQIKKKYTSWKN